MAPTAYMRAGRSRHAILMGGVLAILLAIGGVALAGRQTPAPAGHRATTATVDPRLIIAPRTLPLRTTLTGGIRLRGTVSPAIPGPNRLHLVLSAPGGAQPVGDALRIVATMPGMRMPPVVVTLPRRGEGYSGTLLLPMFGRYRAGILLLRGRGRRHAGALTITLSLPGWGAQR